MTKVNIREALNQIDKDTNCKYDLVTLYEGYNFNDEEKKEIAKMISDNEDAEVIYDRLSDKFGEDVDFDDDISDISLDECDTTTDYEEYFDFDDLDEDTIKTSKGKWVNKGEEGTHGTFDTKKEADAQRRAMFASGWKGESFKESLEGEDGWSEDIVNICEPFFNSVEKIAYEIRNNVRGAHNTGTTVEWLIEVFNQFSIDAEDIIEELEENKDTLNEASYGGAYDIAEDEYFTKEDGMEAANEVAYQLEKEFPEAKLEVVDMQLDNHSFYVTLTDKEGNEFTEEITLDMRKIRHPLDLIKKYAPALTDRFIKQINDYYSEM